jgi:hypothetical protein
MWANHGKTYTKNLRKSPTPPKEGGMGQPALSMQNGNPKQP